MSRSNPATPVLHVTLDLPTKQALRQLALHRQLAGAQQYGTMVDLTNAILAAFLRGVGEITRDPAQDPVLVFGRQAAALWQQIHTDGVGPTDASG